MFNFPLTCSDLLVNHQSPSHILKTATKLLSSLQEIDWNNVFDENTCNRIFYSQESISWKAVEYLIIAIPEKIVTASKLAQRIVWILGKEISNFNSSFNTVQILTALLHNCWQNKSRESSQGMIPNQSPLQSQTLWDTCEFAFINNVDTMQESTHHVAQLYRKELPSIVDSNVIISPPLRRWLLWELQHPSNDPMNLYYLPLLKEVFLQIQFNDDTPLFIQSFFVALIKCFSSSHKLLFKIIHPISQFLSEIASNIESDWMLDLLVECPLHYLKQKEAIESALNYFPPSVFIPHRNFE